MSIERLHRCLNSRIARTPRKSTIWRPPNWLTSKSSSAKATTLILATESATAIYDGVVCSNSADFVNTWCARQARKHQAKGWTQTAKLELPCTMFVAVLWLKQGIQFVQGPGGPLGTSVLPVREEFFSLKPRTKNKKKRESRQQRQHDTSQT